MWAKTIFQLLQGLRWLPLKSLPFSNCSSKDVVIHPAVAAGVVDVELTNVLLNNGPADVENVKKRAPYRGCSRERCFTHFTEIERLKKNC